VTTTAELSTLLENISTAVKGAEDAERRVAAAAQRENELARDIATKTQAVSELSHSLTDHEQRLASKKAELAQAQAAVDHARELRQTEEARVRQARVALDELKKTVAAL
jgi:hypothetical protein